MAEAQPSKKRGGHAYGRRHQRLSNTAIEGELCLYKGHSIGRFSSHSMRYDSHHACTRCVAAAREGRLSLDIDRLLQKNKERALKFWSQVDIGDPNECWNWNGTINPRTHQPQFSWRRHAISSSTQHHPQRVAMWFSWGDLGFTGVKTTCGNKYCCNPFHLLPQHVGVFVDQDSYIENFELQCELHTLKQVVHEYQVDKALKEQEKAQLKQHGHFGSESLLIDPSADFSDKYQSVLIDMLQGNHITQAEAQNIIDEFGKDV